MARARLDAVAAAAVDRARDAALDVADPDTVGEHLEVVMEGERLVTHYFGCLAAGYPGWRWAVTLARAPRSKVATVCEVGLVAGPGSVVAPEWLPWSDRVRPGDLGPGDVLPRDDDDERLEQGYEAVGDGGEADRVAVWELGLGRPRVLSTIGREEAGQRWQTGDFGPQSTMAKTAVQKCRSCGFVTPIAGVLRQGFAICTNRWSPADGHVVSLDYGCGAHSETELERSAYSPPDPIVDDQVVDLVVLPVGVEPAAPQQEATEPDTVGGSTSASTRSEQAAVEPVKSHDGGSEAATVEPGESHDEGSHPQARPAQDTSASGDGAPVSATQVEGETEEPDRSS
ncbi:MAG: DUF3027 domain-containing protein [Actinomycetales bacterium]